MSVVSDARDSVQSRFGGDKKEEAATPVTDYGAAVNNFVQSKEVYEQNVNNWLRKNNATEAVAEQRFGPLSQDNRVNAIKSFISSGSIADATTQEQEQQSFEPLVQLPEQQSISDQVLSVGAGDNNTQSSPLLDLNNELTEQAGPVPLDEQAWALFDNSIGAIGRKGIQAGRWIDKNYHEWRFGNEANKLSKQVNDSFSKDIFGGMVNITKTDSASGRDYYTVNDWGQIFGAERSNTQKSESLGSQVVGSPLDIYQSTIDTLGDDVSGYDMMLVYKTNLLNAGYKPELVDRINVNNLNSALRNVNTFSDEFEDINERRTQRADSFYTKKELEDQLAAQKKYEELNESTPGMNEFGSEVLGWIDNKYGNSVTGSAKASLMARTQQTKIDTMSPMNTEISQAALLVDRAKEGGEKSLANELQGDIDDMIDLRNKFNSSTTKLLKMIIDNGLEGGEVKSYIKDTYDMDFDEWLRKDMGYDGQQRSGLIPGFGDTDFINILEMSPDDMMRMMAVNVTKKYTDRSKNVSTGQKIYTAATANKLFQTSARVGENIVNRFQGEMNDQDLAEIAMLDGVPGYQAGEISNVARNKTSQYADEVGGLFINPVGLPARGLNALRGVSRGISLLNKSKRVDNTLRALGRFDTAISAGLNKVGLGGKLSTTSQTQRAITNSVRVAKNVGRELQIEAAVFNLDTNRGDEFNSQLGLATMMVPFIYDLGKSGIKNARSPFSSQEVIDAVKTDQRFMTRDTLNSLRDTARSMYVDVKDAFIKNPVLGKQLKSNAALGEISKKITLSNMGGGAFNNLTDDSALDIVRTALSTGTDAQQKAFVDKMVGMVKDPQYNVADIFKVANNIPGEVSYYGIKSTVSDTDAAVKKSLANNIRKHNPLSYTYKSYAKDINTAVFGKEFFPDKTLTKVELDEAFENAQSYGVYSKLFDSDIGEYYFKNVGTDKKPMYRLTPEGKEAVGAQTIYSRDYVSNSIIAGDDVADTVAPYLSNDPELLARIRELEVGDEMHILLSDKLC